MRYVWCALHSIVSRMHDIQLGAVFCCCLFRFCNITSKCTMSISYLEICVWCLCKQATHKIHYTPNWNLNIVDKFHRCTGLLDITYSLMSLIQRIPDPVSGDVSEVGGGGCLFWFCSKTFRPFDGRYQNMWASMTEKISLWNFGSKNEVKEFWLHSQIRYAVAFRMNSPGSSFSFASISNCIRWVVWSSLVWANTEIQFNTVRIVCVFLCKSEIIMVNLN